MIVEEFDAYIGCTDCEYRFNYSTTGLHCDINKVYDTLLKRHLTDCPHCSTGTLTVVRAKYKIESNKCKYTARWECKICGIIWTQTEYLEKNSLSSKEFNNYFTDNNNVTCPNPSCEHGGKKLIGMSRG